MRQFHKGQRLIKLCDQKTRTEQQLLSRNMRQRQNLLDEIERCKAEIQTLEQMLIAQQLHGVATSKAEIYTLRRQQAILLHQRQQLRLEHTMREENLRDVDNEIAQCHRQLTILKRKEMKFTKWTQSSKKDWLLQKETSNEIEQQESAPWHLHH
jgi:chromosome segregation ATPase